jgi:hypothetical protein
MMSHLYIQGLALQILAAGEPKAADEGWLHGVWEALRELFDEAQSGAGLLAILVGIVGVLAAWRFARRTDDKLEDAMRQVLDVVFPTIVGAVRPSLSSAAPSPPDPANTTLGEKSGDGDASVAETAAPPAPAAAPAAPAAGLEQRDTFGMVTVAAEREPQRDYVGAADVTGDGHMDFLNQSGDARGCQFKVTTLDSAVGSGPVSRRLTNRSGSNFFVESADDSTIVATLDIGANQDRVLRRYRWAAGKFDQVGDRPVSELSAEDLARYEGPPAWGTDAVPV